MPQLTTLPAIFLKHSGKELIRLFKRAYYYVLTRLKGSTNVAEKEEEAVSRTEESEIESVIALLNGL